MGLGPMPLGGDSEQAGEYLVEAQQGEWVLPAREWMPQAWGPTQQRQAPLTGGSTIGTNRKAVKSLDSSCEECVHTGLPGKGGLKPWSWITCFPPLRSCMPYLSPILSWVNATSLLHVTAPRGARSRAAPFTSEQIWLWDTGVAWSWVESEEAFVAIVGAYSSSAQKQPILWW